ncbi:hypothetical protein HDU76_006101 [Blyttiomyces sp. JEL0837]|nr:hypothetical protein HDU76_006101 [Blyttiomyces sp. JEL0837]
MTLKEGLSGKLVGSRVTFQITALIISVALVTVGVIFAREVDVMQSLADAMGSVQKKTDGAIVVPDPAMINDLIPCMSKAPTYAASQLCWSKYREARVFDMLDRMEALPFDEVQRFQDDQQYEFFQLLIPTHECDTLKLQRFGVNAYGKQPGELHPDGPKWMCPEYFETGSEQCVIFSVGSRGDFAFETSIKQFVGDRCKIYTFDCTGSWENPVTEFHPWCISGQNEVIDGRVFKTLDTMMADVGVTKIHLFKIDVDGFEWPIMDVMESAPVEALPKQMLIELHLAPWPYSPGVDKTKNETWIKPSVKTYKQLRRLGYSIAFRELNFYGRVAAEFVLIHDP